MTEIAGKKVSESSIEGHHVLIFPNDLNSNNTAFGGRIMEIADMLAAICANKHSGKTCATLIVDSLRFLSPAKRGEILIFYAAVNRAWTTSMEVGIKVVANKPPQKEMRKVVSAFFTLVALDKDDRPSQTVPLIPETDEEKRRYDDAQRRRESRILAAKKKEEQRNSHKKK